MVKRLKILAAVFVLSLVVCSPQLVADEKYTANELARRHPKPQPPGVIRKFSA